VRLFDTRKDHWEDHFHRDGPRILGITDIGRTTAWLLQFNSDLNILQRQAILEKHSLDGTHGFPATLGSAIQELAAQSVAEEFAGELGYGISDRPASYLRRWLNSSRLFGDDIRPAGVLPGGRFVISQLFVEGAMPTTLEMHKALSARGWQQNRSSGTVWTSSEGSIVIHAAPS
jgi:hypothetical protein